MKRTNTRHLVNNEYFVLKVDYFPLIAGFNSVFSVANSFEFAAGDGGHRTPRESTRT